MNDQYDNKRGDDVTVPTLGSGMLLYHRGENVWDFEPDNDLGEIWVVRAIGRGDYQVADLVFSDDCDIEL